MSFTAPRCPSLSAFKDHEIRANVLGELQLDVSVGWSVVEQVLVGARLLKSPGVDVVAIGPHFLVVRVAVDDAGPVLLLIVARAGKLEEGEKDRDRTDTDPEASLHRVSAWLASAPSVRG